MIEKIKQLDLSTREGRDAALRLIGEQRMADAISQFHASIEAEADTPTLEDQLEGVETLFEFLSERPRPAIVQWDDIPNTKREWLINAWLPANTVTMFTGEGGAGKSWLTLQAVCQVCCGYKGAFLDPNFQRVADKTPPRNVVFATYEDEPAEIKRRLHVLASGMPWIEKAMKTIKSHLHVVDMRGIGSVWGPGIGKHIQNTGELLAAGEDLRAICQREDIKASLLVMDPLSGAFGGNENDRTAVYDFVSDFRGWGDEAQCAMLVIGHLPKSQEGKAAGFSGSTAWEASARSMWKLSQKSFEQTDPDDKKEEKVTRHYWTLEHTKSNYAPIQSERLLGKRKQGWWAEAQNQVDAANAFEAYQQGREHDTQQEDNADESGEIIPRF